MATDNQQKTGTPNNYQSDRGGATLITEPVLGVVKNNVDPTKSGRIQVYIAKFGSSSPDDSKSWVTVSYLSPFAGISGGDGGGTEGYGKFVGNPQSYGFWASAPDIGTQVICIFVDGDAQNGFYIGCVPQAGLLHMTPAIGASTNVVPNKAEAKTYGGADRLPTSEVNAANPNLANSGTIASEPKPIHSYQASILFDQGLVRDNSRGVISSSAQRETPSRVFGLSTPGGPIYAGGYTSNNIKEASKTADTSKLQQVGRTGGHSLVMDDGGLQGEDTLMRFRSSSGHMIMFNDTAQTLFVIHANGQSWIELGKEGTVDMYATNSVNIRTQGDLNLHADRDVNIHAAKNFNLYGDNLNLEADTNLGARAGSKLAVHGKGGVAIKSEATMAVTATGEASFASSSTTYINGSKVNLNTGNGPAAEAVPAMPKTNHPDTAYSTEKGWIYPSPTALLSITSRAPTHQPWIGAGKGVDIKIEAAVNSSKPVTTSAVDKVNNTTPNVPAKPVTPSVASTLPTQKARNPVGDLNGPAVTALAAQNAVTNATMPDGAPFPVAIKGNGTGVAPVTPANPSQASTPSPETKAGGGVLPGPAGVTMAQAAAPGSMLKPGSESLVCTRMAQGMPPEQALQGLVTGNNGATSAIAALTSVSTQLAAVTGSINNAATSLVNSGILTGKESAGQAGGVVLAAANYGVGLVSGVIGGVQNAVSGVVGGVQSAVSNLVSGTIGGALSSAQGAISGITGSIQGGIAQAAQLAGGVQAAASKISDAISGGNFAGMMSDNISNGLSGLASSVTGALKNGINGIIGGITNQVAGLASSLTGVLKKAFDAVESSYKNLQAGLPNKLGGAAGIESASDLNSPGAKYESAKAAVDLAQKAYDQAVAAYRNDSSSENKSAIDEAESKLSSARKTAASASVGIITGAVGSVVDGAINAVKGIGTSISNSISGVTGAVNNVAGSVNGAVGSVTNAVSQLPVTTANSGMNALPGGVGAIASQVVAGASNTVTGILGGISSAANSLLTSPVKMIGNLVQGTANAITGAVGGVVNAATGVVTGAVSAVTGAVGQLSQLANAPAQLLNSLTSSANGILSTIQTTLASIGSMGGQIKSTITAVGTFDKSAMTAKTGELIANSIVPTPLSAEPAVQSAPPPSDTPDESVAKKVKALQKINEINNQLEETKNRLANLTLQYDKNPSESLTQQIQAVYTERRELYAKLTQAQDSYSSAVSGQSKPPNNAEADPRLTTGPTANYFSQPESIDVTRAKILNQFNRS